MLQGAGSRMRILLANYRYFVSGGPERYLFNARSALAERGHEVIPFSVDYARNVETPFSRYFVAPAGGRDEVYFKNQRRTPRTILKTLARAIYSPEVERAVQRLARDTKPDVAYVLHYLRKLSPALLVGLKRAGVPIVVRLSDYAMLCPQAHFLRDNTPCQSCRGGDLLPSIQHRCVQGSLAASLVNAGATWFHRMRRYFDLIDVFVVTNPFMKRQMLLAGYPEERLRLIPTFVNTEVFRPAPPSAKGNYVVYTGRLEFIKGVHVLVEAAALLRQARPDVRWKFKFAGSGDEQYVSSLKRRVNELRIDDIVQFVGNLDEQSLNDLIGRARLSAIPSLWFENLPNSLLESYACGTPVLASALGSLDEAVVDGMTGLCFPTGNAVALAQALGRAWDNPQLVAAMSEQARSVAVTQYSAEPHLASLESLLRELSVAARRSSPGRSGDPV